MQVAQLVNISTGFGNISSQMIPNLKGGGVGTVWLRSGRELPQLDEPQPSPGPAEAKTEP
ncbi:hypothetical protein CR513_09541, partial [Mucuna pruriens]